MTCLGPPDWRRLLKGKILLQSRIEGKRMTFES